MKDPSLERRGRNFFLILNNFPRPSYISQSYELEWNSIFWYQSIFIFRMIDWLIDWLIDFVIDWLIDWLIDWFCDWLIDWLIDFCDWFNLLIDWLVDELNDWLIGSLIGSKTNASINWSILGWRHHFSIMEYLWIWVHCLAMFTRISSFSVYLKSLQLSWLSYCFGGLCGLNSLNAKTLLNYIVVTIRDMLSILQRAKYKRNSITIDKFNRDNRQVSCWLCT